MTRREHERTICFVRVASRASPFGPLSVEITERVTFHNFKGESGEKSTGLPLSPRFGGRPSDNFPRRISPRPWKTGVSPGLHSPSQARPPPGPDPRHVMEGRSPRRPPAQPHRNPSVLQGQDPHGTAEPGPGDPGEVHLRVDERRERPPVQGGGDVGVRLQVRALRPQPALLQRMGELDHRVRQAQHPTSLTPRERPVQLQDPLTAAAPPPPGPARARASRTPSTPLPPPSRTPPTASHRPPRRPGKALPAGRRRWPTG